MGRSACQIITKLTLTFHHRKPRLRKPAPGWKITYHSVLFQHDLRVRATLSCQRAIENAGGFDRYIYYTPEENLRSPLAITLKRRMNALVAKYPTVEPPPLDKRKPKPMPKKLSVNIKPVQVCDTNKYVYLG